MANDNGFIQLEKGDVLGRPSWPDGFFPDSPASAAPNDNGFGPAVTNFPNTHCIWGINMFKRLPDVVERGYAANSDSGIFEVTPSDAAMLPTYISQFYIGGSGDVKFETEAGEIITMVGLAEGVVYPFTFSIVKIFATGTTAQNIVGIF
jgi:hypothetical protein